MCDTKSVNCEALLTKNAVFTRVYISGVGNTIVFFLTTLGGFNTTVLGKAEFCIATQNCGVSNTIVLQQLPITTVLVTP